MPHSCALHTTHRDPPGEMRYVHFSSYWCLSTDFIPSDCKGEDLIYIMTINKTVLSNYILLPLIFSPYFSLTWKRNASPTELLRQKTKSFFGCSGTACTMLFSTHSACFGTLLWSMPKRLSDSYRKRVQP